MSQVPFDILFCILVSLPVKSLLRFQSVSKSWNTIIFDNEFKKAHCDQSRALGRFKFLLHKRRIGYTNNVDEIDIIELKNPKIVIEKQQLPLSSSHIICSHDGLVLLHTRKSYDTFILWNPSIRQHKIFVCPYLSDSSALLPNACGLCHDSTTDDYKIILIYRSFYLVCYANTNFWMMKQITIPILEQSINYCWPHKCCEGISISGGYVYWSRSTSKLLFQHVSKISTIIRFNTKSDELECLPTPGFICEEELYFMSTLNGCLSLCGGKMESLCGGIMESNIWIMEQDKWKSLVKIRRITPCVRSTKILCCTKDGKVIFHGPKLHYVSIFNPRNHTFVTNCYTNNCSECVYRDPTCLDSFSFIRLDHLQDEAL